MSHLTRGAWIEIRKELSYYDRKVRYLACGEYGSRNGRPHYHVLLFGFVPGDNVLCSTGDLFSTYSSPLISRLWCRTSHEVRGVK